MIQLAVSNRVYLALTMNSRIVRGGRTGKNDLPRFPPNT